MKRTAIVATLGILLATCAARAETMVADSLEWMTVDCDLVVLARIAAATEVSVEDSDKYGPYHDLTLVVRVLRPSIFHRPLQPALRIRAGDYGDALSQAGDTEWLFFLDRVNDEEGNAVNYYSSALYQPRGHGRLSDFAINLDDPSKVYGADMVELKDRDAILARVEQGLAITELGLDGAEVRHRFRGSNRFRRGTGPGFVGPPVAGR